MRKPTKLSGNTRSKIYSTLFQAHADAKEILDATELTADAGVAARGVKSVLSNFDGFFRQPNSAFAQSDQDQLKQLIFTFLPVLCLHLVKFEEHVGKLETIFPAVLIFFELMNHYQARFILSGEGFSGEEDLSQESEGRTLAYRRF